MVVTIACICYNQAPFLEETVQSILAQTYSPLDIWVLDDASTDNSREIIQSLGSRYPSINVYCSQENIGHNRLFNQFLGEYNGQAIIDLAADDLLHPDRVAAGVDALRKDPSCGVHFTNAELINDKGEFMSAHYAVNEAGCAIVKVPQGDVFTNLVGTYFINPVSMMIRKNVLDELQGFDETLSYEDFDFWIRSARNHRYCYTDRVLVSKRIHASNYSKQQYRFGSRQMLDTFKVCQKIRKLIRSADERNAFHRRLGYEMRQCLRNGNLRLFFRYFQLL